MEFFKISVVETLETAENPIMLSETSLREIMFFALLEQLRHFILPGPDCGRTRRTRYEQGPSP